MQVPKMRRQSGQALTEFAFVLPFILLLLLGVIEMGRYAYISILIGNAARAGAAYAAQNPSTSTDTTGITNAADYDFAGATSGTTALNGQSSSALTVTSSTTCGCDSAGTFTAAIGCSYATNPSAGTCASGSWVIMVSVTASGTFNALFNYPGIPSSLTISRTAELRVA
jgi:Flp pilus assembly protein TadG